MRVITLARMPGLSLANTRHIVVASDGFSCCPLQSHSCGEWLGTIFLRGSGQEHVYRRFASAPLSHPGSCKSDPHFVVHDVTW